MICILSIQLPPTIPSFSLPSSLTKTLRQYCLKEIIFHSLSKCCPLHLPADPGLGHTDPFSLPGEMIFPGRGEHELQTSAKATIQTMSCFLQNQYQTSLTPDGPRHGTVPKHNSPARHLIHYISASPSFRRAGLSYCPARFSTLYLLFTV